MDGATALTETPKLLAHPTLAENAELLCGELGLDINTVNDWLQEAEKLKPQVLELNKALQARLEEANDQKKGLPEIILSLPSPIAPILGPAPKALSDSEKMAYLQRTEASHLAHLLRIIETPAQRILLETLLFTQDTRWRGIFNTLALVMRTKHYPEGPLFKPGDSLQAPEVSAFLDKITLHLPSLVNHPLDPKEFGAKVNVAKGRKTSKHNELSDLPHATSRIFATALALQTGSKDQQDDPDLREYIYDSVNHCLLFNNRRVQVLAQHHYKIVFVIWLEEAQRRAQTCDRTRSWLTNPESVVWQRVREFITTAVRNGGLPRPLGKFLKEGCVLPETEPAVTAMVAATKKKAKKVSLKKVPPKRTSTRNPAPPEAELPCLPAPRLAETSTNLARDLAAGQNSFCLVPVPDNSDAARVLINTGRGERYQSQAIRPDGIYNFRRPKYKPRQNYTITIGYGRAGDNTPSGEVATITFTIPEAENPKPADAPPANPNNGLTGPGFGEDTANFLGPAPDITTSLSLCEACQAEVEAALALPENQIRWQIAVAELLLEYFDQENWEEILKTPVFTDNTVQLFFQDILPEWEAGQSLTSITLQLEPLAILAPQQDGLEDTLGEILPSLITWTQQIRAEREATMNNREAVNQWRTATPFRQAKVRACRTAVNFKPWEQHQTGTFGKAGGPKFPLYSWDRVFKEPQFKNDRLAFLEHMQQAGISIKHHYQRLESGSKVQAVLSSLDLTIDELDLNFTVHINRVTNHEQGLFSFTFPDEATDVWRNELSRIGIGTVCMLGIITESDSPLKSGHAHWKMDPDRFTFSQKSLHDRAKNTDQGSSFMAIVNRMNEGRGRVQSLESDRGFEWGASWADFADAGRTVFQNAHFKEDKSKAGPASARNYQIIQESDNWQKYALLRIWKSLKMNKHVEGLNRRTGVGPFENGMLRIVKQVWENLMTPEERDSFMAITSPSKAIKFEISGGRNFVQTIVGLWQEAQFGIHIEPRPVFKGFEDIVRFCDFNNIKVIAHTPEDFAVLNGAGHPDLHIEKAYQPA